MSLIDYNHMKKITISLTVFMIIIYRRNAITLIVETIDLLVMITTV